MEDKKSLVALALVALVGIVGGTFAYFTSSAKLTNEFTTGTYSTSVKEEFVSPDNWTPGTTTKKKVNVTNNGSVEVAVRATYTEKWTAKDGTVLSGTRNGEKVAQFTIGSDWELATDGYYYYKGILTSGQTSSDFISSVTFNPNFELEEGTDIECTTTKENGKVTSSCTSLTSGYAGATYSLEITIETIQADQKWGYTSKPEVEMIAFTIDGNQHQAESGMTWVEWVDSEYNTIDAFLGEAYEETYVNVGELIYISELYGEVPYLYISSNSKFVEYISSEALIEADKQYYVVDERHEWTGFTWASLFAVDDYYIAFDPLYPSSWNNNDEGTIAWIDHIADGIAWSGFASDVAFRGFSLVDGTYSEETDEWLSQTLWQPEYWYDDYDFDTSSQLEYKLTLQAIKNEDFIVGIYDTNSGDYIPYYLCYSDGTHVKYGDNIMELHLGSYKLIKK